MNDELKDIEEQGLYEHHSLKIEKGQSLLRIDKFLTNRLEGVSRSRVQKAAEAGSILVNKKPVKSNYKVKPLDEISVVMPYPPRDMEIIPENIPLSIAYEDNDLLVVNKPAGMVVHPGVGNPCGTLVNALAYYFRDLPKHSADDVRTGLVHRIDKDTSGLLVVAKNELTLNRLSKLFFDRAVHRLYVAMVWGLPKPDSGTITGHVGRGIHDKTKFQVYPDGDYCKNAITHYRLLEDLGYVSLIECKLETGRTHQIRVHMSHIGHPLFSDEKYGGSEILRGTTFAKYKQFVRNCFELLPRQALHAKVLGFTHPTTGKDMYFEAPLPADMAAAAEKWRRYLGGREEQ